MKLNQTQNCSLLGDSENPRSFIPIVPCFQLEVPRWEAQQM